MDESDRELDSDVRAMAEDIRRDAQRVEEIEREKVAYGISHPRASALSAEAELIVGRMVRSTRAERELSQRSEP